MTCCVSPLRPVINPRLGIIPSFYHHSLPSALSRPYTRLHKPGPTLHIVIYTPSQMTAPTTNRIRARRHQLGPSLHKVATLTDLDPSTIWRTEQGRTAPGRATQNLIATALQTTRETLWPT